MPAPLLEGDWSLSRRGVALVTEDDGTISGDRATGLYVHDRRILAGLRVTIDGRPPTLLSGSRTGPAARELVYCHWGGTSDPDALVERTTTIGDRFDEVFVLRSFNTPLDLTFAIELSPGGATIYHLDDEEPAPVDEERLLARLDPGDFELRDRSLVATVSLRPGEERRLAWGLTLDVPRVEVPSASAIHWSGAPVRSAQRAVDIACWDLDALSVADPLTGRSSVAAGAPHFLAIFGRDALIVSLLGMLAGTERAVEVLRVLAAHQGVVDDPRTLEAPGRILHELRLGEMGVFGLEPGVPYYGSVDATPLFVVTLAEAMRWGAELDAVRELLPAARRAAAWCRRHVDAIGFVHSIPHDGGIANQGWKDAFDSNVRADGSVVRGPTSLVEVQGYVHDALLGLAEIEDTLGDPDRAAGLRAEAATFRRRFASHFLVGPPAHVAVALDESGAPIPVRASNVGHLLATDLVDDELAALLAARLLDDDEFSGWGVRTLARSERAYHPLGYHSGTVWPHDTAMFLRGLHLRGLTTELGLVSRALLDLADALDGALPELVAGFARAGAPVPYPSSARPQAWSAAVPLQVLTATLGLRPEIHRGRLALRPQLAPGERITVEGLRLGGRRLHIEAAGRGATVDGDTDGLAITVES